MKDRKKFFKYRKKCSKCGRQPPVIYEHLLVGNRQYCEQCLPLLGEGLNR